MKTSPAQRSLKLLRDMGYEAQVVERWNQYAKVRQDLFGWVDIVATDGKGNGVVFVQTTTGDHVQARVDKARGNKALIKLVLDNCRLVVHGWRKVGGRWQVRWRWIQTGDLIGGEGA